MTSTLPVNMQQVFHMGTYTEKLQHTILTTPNVTAQQEDKKQNGKSIQLIDQIYWEDASHAEILFSRSKQKHLIDMMNKQEFCLNRSSK